MRVAWKYPKIKDGKLTRWNWMVQGVKHFKLGYKTDIGAFTYINATHGVTIEDYVQVGSHCSIYSRSTIGNKAGEVILKEGCCVGSHSVVMPGITIGNNAIVGAGAVVTKDVPDNTTVVGIPAKEM